MTQVRSLTDCTTRNPPPPARLPGSEVFHVVSECEMYKRREEVTSNSFPVQHKEFGNHDKRPTVDGAVLVGIEMPVT